MARSSTPRFLRPWIVGLTLGTASMGTAQAEFEPPLAVSERVGEQLTSADVMARLQLVLKHLDQLRRHMGRPLVEDPALRVEAAGNRQVYFGIGNLRRRLTALEFELLRRRSEWIKEPPMVVQPVDLFGMLNEALVTTAAIEQVFGLPLELAETPVEADVPPEVMSNQLFAAGALVDSLLEQPSTLSETYMFVTFSTLVALDLHRVLTQRMIPPEPELVPEQTNRDVLKGLLSCLSRIERIFARLEVPAAKVEIAATKERIITADDLSNVISLLVSELLWFRSRVPGTKPPVDPYAVGPKIPSELVQRVGLLEAILGDIESAPDLGPESIVR